MADIWAAIDCPADSAGSIAVKNVHCRGSPQPPTLDIKHIGGQGKADIWLGPKGLRKTRSG